MLCFLMQENMFITQGGCPPLLYDAHACGDDLSSTIVRGIVKDIRYSRDEKNHLEVLL